MKVIMGMMVAASATAFAVASPTVKSSLQSNETCVGNGTCRTMPADGRVFTRISECGRYEYLHPGFVKAFAFLRRHDLAQLACGRYDIDGTNCWAQVMDVKLKPLAEEDTYEVHRAFIDIQSPISGDETFGSLKPDPKVFENFNEKKDYVLFKAKGEVRTLKPGEVVIFFPETGAHAPCLSESGLRTVRKLVIKVRK